MVYSAPAKRYDEVPYRRCGRSGLLLPTISLGFWHNFGGVDVFENGRAMARRAFDLGITHFDLANNYGPPPGSAEESFGVMMQKDFKPYRDEMIISTKAGWRMWPGPYGDFGSRKYLVASIDQSLKRMGLDYVDVFYSHRPDPQTPMEETMGALDYIVRSGRALYVGISSYSPEQTEVAAGILRDLGTPCLVHQPSYNMFDRWIEGGLTDVLDTNGIGCIVFSPLHQGVLTDKYLDGIPSDSRAAKESGWLREDEVTDAKISKVRALKQVAESRGQTIAQLAISWTLRRTHITSSLIGASRISHIDDAVAAAHKAEFSDDENARIEDILGR